MMMSFLQTKLSMNLNHRLNPLVNPSVIFNYDMTSNTPFSLPHFFFFIYFSLQQSTQSPLILSQINFPLQIQSPQHSVCQHPCSDSNFIENSPLQVRKIIHFLFELNFKMLIFIAYFCSIFILFGCLFVL